MITRDMKGSHFSIFMMTVTIAYSAPPTKSCITRRQGSYTDNQGRIVVPNNRNTNNDRNNNNDVNGSGKTERHRKRCCPYDFDSQKCQIVNDRKVCGYNMNSGGPGDNPVEQTMNIGNGCFFRRGRLECGYQAGPFVGIRRPPVYDNKIRETTTQQKQQDIEQTYQDDSEHEPTDDDNQNYDHREKLIRTLPDKPTLVTQSLPKCVKIRRRIVCNTLDANKN